MLLTRASPLCLEPRHTGGGQAGMERRADELVCGLGGPPRQLVVTSCKWGATWPRASLPRCRDAVGSGWESEPGTCGSEKLRHWDAEPRLRGGPLKVDDKIWFIHGASNYTGAPFGPMMWLTIIACVAVFFTVLVGFRSWADRHVI